MEPDFNPLGPDAIKLRLPYSTMVTTADLMPLQGEPFSLNVPGVETPG
jgi:hypothetical protein